MPVLALLFGACYYDKEDVLYPEIPCAAVTSPGFSTDILPIMNARCNNCHAGAFASAGIRLDSYGEVLKYANSGSLMGSIRHSPGYSAMPKNGGKITACEIQKMEAWISSGLNNN